VAGVFAVCMELVAVRPQVRHIRSIATAFEHKK
jgi:hypothetical protein